MLDIFEDKIIEMIHKFTKTQNKAMHRIATHIVDCIETGGTFFAIGTGHSHMVGEEFYARAGGLACVRLIAPMELTLGEHPLKSTQIERIGDYANVIISQYNISKGDIVLISSHSGRNALPIELSLLLKEMGVPTIAFTSMEHSQNVGSRHPSGLRLFEVCDDIIDSCGVYKDTLMEIDGVKGEMGASSSIMGMYMAQCLSMLIAEEMAKRGLEVPVFLSSNIDGGDQWNHSLMKKYYHI